MSEAKKFDSNKAPLSLIDPVFTEQVARALAIGESKYGRNDWRGLMVERLLDAVKRHTLEIEKGNDLDDETGLPHAAHAASGLMFIEWLRRNRPEQDDRRWSGENTKLSGTMPVATSVEALQAMIAGWADKVFPDRTVDEAVRKLKKEIGELDESGFTDAGEFADVAILILDVMHLQGIDFAKAVTNKHRINEGRKWQRLEDGTRQHIVEAGPVVKPQCHVCGEEFDYDCERATHIRTKHGAKK